MITAQNNLIGRISAKQNITGKLNNAVVREYPELEDLTVTPSSNEQNFKSEKYGFNNVIVKAVESEELNITPSDETQIKEGIFNKVIIAGDSDLIPENIKEGTEIFGVQGSAKTTNVKISDCQYLFSNNARKNIINELLILCDKPTRTDKMFYNSQSLKSEQLDLSNFDTSNVTRMDEMFRDCRELTELDLSNFDTSNVTDMSYMFYSCNKLSKINLSNFNTSKVTNMGYMFYGSQLQSLDLSSFDTSSVTNMNSMFSYSSLLENLDLSNFDFSKVNSITYMFRSCYNLTNLKGLKNIGKAYTSKLNNYGSYRISLEESRKLTHDSLMNVINNLYDLNLTYNVANGGTLYTQQLILGSTNIAKLTAEEIAIATNKRLDSFLERREYEIFFLYKTKNDSSR